MPPSQLERLKQSLRDQGFVGPQKSKKQKKRQNGAFKDSRIQRNAALQGIREQFNPFEVKPATRRKHEFTSREAKGERVAKPVVQRPGVTKGLGEQSRRNTLLVEMQRRKKVGGIMDRRFGENDPTMTPEERALERFVEEKQRGNKRSALFDLEDGEEESQLTHFGQSLSFDKPPRSDDFNEIDIKRSDEDSKFEDPDERPPKRQRISSSVILEEGSAKSGRPVQTERQKSKREVMEEVIAKSKLYKYERQQAKEDDDDLRAELDKGIPDLFALMIGRKQQADSAPQRLETSDGIMNPDRMALLNGKEISQADKEYDERLRQLREDQRAAPTTKTLTDEEKVQQEAHKLKELEERRLRRMRGESEASDSDAVGKAEILNGGTDEDRDDKDEYGLGPGLDSQPENRELGVEDEDDFLLDDDLLASGSESGFSESEEFERVDDDPSDNDEREFIEGLLSKNDADREGLDISKGPTRTVQANGSAQDLAYIYKCPETHEDLLDIMKEIAIQDAPTVVQRIRALYHPKLASDNKAKLGQFSMVLVDHVTYLANSPEHPPFVILEALIRHIHSLAKTFPEEVGRAIRSHLNLFHQQRPMDPAPGDLLLLTAISSIFPTSDHFHQVVTPAMLCMTRYLSQKLPQTLSDLAIGTYVSGLCLQYQRLSKRYIPELVNYVLNALGGLMPVQFKSTSSPIPHHKLPDSLRLQASSNGANHLYRRLDFWDILPTQRVEDNGNQELQIALFDTHITMIDSMAAMWAEKPAFCETLDPIYSALQVLSAKPCSRILKASTLSKIQATSQNLRHLFQQSLQNRQPLRLHNHRPLAIKTSIPKFEEYYNPDKHYDPDRERAEISKLKAEHKRERKGALRELRKDANFIARESLREKKERDIAYEKKYKRLVAEIQGEEGREGKIYDREKRMRKGRK